MRINIKIFDHLDAAFQRIKGDSIDRDWTDASSVRWTTLSELRLLGKLLKQNPEVKTGRACTLEKIIALGSGLIKLKGEGVVKKELLRVIAAEEDQDVRFIIKAIIITKHAGEEAKKNADTMLDMVLKTIPD